MQSFLTVLETAWAPLMRGFLLTLGMSVDSNILIFERLREEVAAGKNLRAALEAAHEKAFSAIFDANITTLITAVLMWNYGTGPVKGFGVTLTIGIFSTMFAALIVTRLLLELIVHTGVAKRIKMFQAMPETKLQAALKACITSFSASACSGVGAAVQVTVRTSITRIIAQTVPIGRSAACFPA